MAARRENRSSCRAASRGVDSRMNGCPIIARPVRFVGEIFWYDNAAISIIRPGPLHA